MRTFHARSRVHEENAVRIVDLLDRSDVVTRVHHPSLPEHPGHDIARRQQTGWGSLVLEADLKRALSRAAAVVGATDEATARRPAAHGARR